MKKIFLTLFVIAILFVSVSSLSLSKVEAYYYGGSYHTYNNPYGGSTTYFNDGGVAHTYTNVYGGTVTYYNNSTYGISGTAHTYNNVYGGTTTYYSFNN